MSQLTQHPDPRGDDRLMADLGEPLPKLSIQPIPMMRGSKRRAFNVTLNYGEWPERGEILKACNDGEPAPFGGDVLASSSTPRERKAFIWID